MLAALSGCVIFELDNIVGILTGVSLFCLHLRCPKMMELKMNSFTGVAAVLLQGRPFVLGTFPFSTPRVLV